MPSASLCCCLLGLAELAQLPCPRCKAQASAGALMPTRAKALWALDFDGVVCDSVGESSLSAWKAATALWPDIFDTDKARDAKAQIMEDMRVVRPVVETGAPRLLSLEEQLDLFPHCAPTHKGVCMHAACPVVETGVIRL